MIEVTFHPDLEEDKSKTFSLHEILTLNEEYIEYVRWLHGCFTDVGKYVSVEINLVK